MVEISALSAGFALLPSDAYGYIDPGAGSMIYQTILAIVLGAGFVVRNAITRLFRRPPESSERDDTNDKRD